MLPSLVMRAILSAVLLLLATRSAAAEEGWAPITVDGIEYEVRLPLAQGGPQTYRMSPARLDQTLERLGRWAGRLTTGIDGSNLPPEVTGAPDRLFGQVAAAARAMGPDLVFSTPPGIENNIDRFSFNDGNELVSFAVSAPDADAVWQQVDVVYRRRVAGAWKLERRTTLLLERDGRWFGDPIFRASYSESLGERDARRTVVELEYTRMKQRGHWLGSELRRGQRGRRAVLRSLDPRSGEPVVSPVPRQVLSRPGRVGLLRARDFIDRAALRKAGVTYVRPSADRKPYLRRLRVSRPSARR